MFGSEDTTFNQKEERYEWIIKPCFRFWKRGFYLGYPDETCNLRWLQILARNLSLDHRQIRN
jgi:hypothetical protein